MYFISRYSTLTAYGVRLSAWQRWLVTAVLIVALTALWYFTAFSMLRAQQTHRLQQHQTLQTQRALCAQLTARADKLQSAVDAAQSNWAQACKQAQQRAGTTALFTLFDQFGKQGVTVKAYYPHSVMQRSWYTKQSAQLHLAGSFEQLLNTFDTLNDESVAYRWEHVRLERQDDNMLNCVATLSSKLPKEGDHVVA